MPELLTLELETDDGIVGLGETWGKASAVEALLHDYAVPVLQTLRPSVMDRTPVWEALFALSNMHGHAGAEMRMLSALDIALWDLAGRALGRPIWSLLGGAMRENISAYNTVKDFGVYEDESRSTEDPSGLVKDLKDQGFAGVKFWPFDRFAPVSSSVELSGVDKWHERGFLGHNLREADLQDGVMLVEKMRSAAGDDFDIYIEGHYRWDLPTAIRIGKALRHLNIGWLEDMTRTDHAADLRRLVEETGVPIVASERFMTRHAYRRVFEEKACHIAMIDLTFCGGITEGRRIADMADTYNLPVSFHDCQGPIGAIANIHLGISQPNAINLEFVRAFLDTWYLDVIATPLPVKNGLAYGPDAPGLGVELSPEFRGRKDVLTRESRVL